MNFAGQRKRAGGPVLEVTPLVDVVFLLLILFLLTATFVRNPNIPIRLPQASVRELTPQKRDIMVGVTAEGDLQYEGKKTSIDSLSRTMRQIHADAPETMVLIQADLQSRHGRVVQVMDVAKQVGFERIGIAIETARSSGGGD